MKQRGWIALVFVLGCATGGVASKFVVPPARAGTNPTRWEYVCTNVGADALTQRVNELGQQGWELATTTVQKQDSDFGKPYATAYSVCAKRALP